jgi:hypothetical protein
MSEPKKFSRTESIKDSIARSKAMQQSAPQHGLQPVPRAPFKKGGKPFKPKAPQKPAGPKKLNPRSAKARDARAAARGRLPDNFVTQELWTGTVYKGYAAARDGKGNVVWDLNCDAKGMFELREAMDIAFWNWFATAPDAEKSRLVFNPDPPKPDPFPKEAVNEPTRP